jgi:hypothetical protein
MAAVIGILGVALVLLIVTIFVLLVQNKDIPAELNTLASLIAGGLIGFLTPHVSSTSKK